MGPQSLCNRSFWRRFYELLFSFLLLFVGAFVIGLSQIFSFFSWTYSLSISINLSIANFPLRQTWRFLHYKLPVPDNHYSILTGLRCFISVSLWSIRQGVLLSSRLLYSLIQAILKLAFWFAAWNLFGWFGDLINNTNPSQKCKSYFTLANSWPYYRLM